MSAIRRMMMRATKKDGYITSGLVFHLDGIDKGTTDTTKWVDLIGGIVFTEPNGTSVHATNHIQLTTLERLVGDTMPDFPHTTHTIECAINRPSANNWTFICLFRKNGVSLYLDSGMYLHCGTGNGYYGTTRFRSNGSFIASCANGLFVVNGLQDTTTQGNAGFNPSYPVVNSTANNLQSYAKNIDVYSIRVYNRLLTADEMLHNQRYDNERFNLGMSFPA